MPHPHFQPVINGVSAYVRRLRPYLGPESTEERERVFAGFRIRGARVGTGKKAQQKIARDARV